MKKLKKIIIMTLCCICFIMPLSTSAIGVKYTDHTTNLTFMVPYGWDMVKLEDKNTMDKARFSNDRFGKETDIIYYNSYDWYNTSIGKGRALTKKYIAEMYDVNIYDIYKVTINDVEYYRFDTKGQWFSNTFLVKLYNGYYFTFRFSTSGNINDADFNGMMKSVDYSNVKENIKPPRDPSNDILLGLSILLIIWLNGLKVSAKAKMWEKRKKKNALEEKDVQNYYTSKRTISTSETEFCRKCGERLTGEKFCINCGTKVRRK